MKDPASLKNDSLKGRVLSLRNRTAGPDEDGKMLTCDKCGRVITFYLGKHDLLTVYLGKLNFLSVTDFSLGNSPRGNFIIWVLDMSRKQ